MEVHHHPHVGKKNFKEYFLEFLMIFLAVTLGFFAENVREYFADRKKETEYIFSFYNDLKNDTDRLNLLIAYDEDKLKGLSSMSDCFDAITGNIKASTCMAALVNNSKTNRNFDGSDRTIKQLSNGGGFHVLEKDDADSMLAYETLCKNYHNFESTAFQEAQDNVRNTLNRLADYRANRELQSSTAVTGDTARAKLDRPLLFGEDHTLLNQYFNELLIYYRVTRGQMIILGRLKNRASGMIAYYKSRHGLEER